MSFYIYLIKNNVNGKVYVGKTVNSKRRWREHLSVVRRGKDKAGKQFQYLHQSLKKHGEDNFSLTTLEICKTEEDALNGEMDWIWYFKSNNPKYGYNLTDGGEGVVGYNYSSRQREAISARQQGSSNSFYGKTHSEEWRRNHSQRFSGENNPMSASNKRKREKIDS